MRSSLNIFAKSGASTLVYTFSFTIMLLYFETSMLPDAKNEIGPSMRMTAGFLSMANSLKIGQQLQGKLGIYTILEQMHPCVWIAK